MNSDYGYRRDRRNDTGQREQNGDAGRSYRERGYAGERGNDREEEWPTTWQPPRTWEGGERRDFRENDSGGSRREYDRDADWRASQGNERRPYADFNRSSRYEAGWNGSDMSAGQGRTGGTGGGSGGWRSGGSAIGYGREQNWRDQDSDWTRSSSDRQADALFRSRESFRGRGPKGYQRSDERLQEDLNDRLTEDHDIDASEIECKVKDGEVTLTGTVPDRETKRRVEDLADALSGVKHVQNNLRVKKSSGSETTSSSNKDKDRSSTGSMSGGSMSGAGSKPSTSGAGR